MYKYLQETKMLDYSNDSIKKLIENKKQNDLDEINKVKAIYDFVRNDILFGYNINDNIKASKVLKDGYGQCNTK